MTDKEIVQDDHPVFVSPGDEPTMIALTRGGFSTSVLPKDQGGTPLHPRFHRAAAMLGCMPIAVAASTVISPGELAGAHRDRKELILTEMTKMSSEAADSEPKRRELFTAAGLPDANALGRRLGFPVTAAERDTVWELYAGSEDGDGDDD